MIRQGDIYLMDFGAPTGSEPGFVRPVVVVQNNVFNRSNIRTVVVCPLTTNLRRGEAPGNVSLFPGEGGLREQSVVNVSQVLAINKEDLEQKIGALDEGRVLEIVVGINLLLEPRDVRE